MRNASSFDVLIIGAGMVGMAIAHELLNRNKKITINIIDKEAESGVHTSGRNSGIERSCHLCPGLFAPI